MAITNPLTDKDLDNIKVQIQTLNDLDEQIRLAEQAGVDVTGQKKQSRESRTQLNRLKQTYFPNRP